MPPRPLPGRVLNFIMPRQAPEIIFITIFIRAESLKIVHSADRRREFEQMYRSPIYPITLNFHESDLFELRSSPEAVRFITRAHLINVDGFVLNALVIEAKYTYSDIAEDTGSTLLCSGSDADLLDLSESLSSMSVHDVLQSNSVTAVQTLNLFRNYADLDVDFSRCV